jgi:hypothetical protein
MYFVLFILGIVTHSTFFISLYTIFRHTLASMAITPPRSVRIPDVLWRKAKAKAKTQHTTVTAVIVKALYDWVNDK